MSINKLLQILEEVEYKNKAEKKTNEEKINLAINQLEDIKKRLEVVQRNRWWPLPLYSKHTESYFIPNIKSNDNESGSETIQVGIQFK